MRRTSKAISMLLVGSMATHCGSPQKVQTSAGQSADAVAVGQGCDSPKVQDMIADVIKKKSAQYPGMIPSSVGQDPVSVCQYMQGKGLALSDEYADDYNTAQQQGDSSSSDHTVTIGLAIAALVAVGVLVYVLTKPKKPDATEATPTPTATGGAAEVPGNPRHNEQNTGSKPGDHVAADDGAGTGADAKEPDRVDSEQQQPARGAGRRAASVVSSEELGRMSSVLGGDVPSQIKAMQEKSAQFLADAYKLGRDEGQQHSAELQQALTVAQNEVYETQRLLAGANQGLASVTEERNEFNRQLVAEQAARRGDVQRLQAAQSLASQAQSDAEHHKSQAEAFRGILHAKDAEGRGRY